MKLKLSVFAFILFTAFSCDEIDKLSEFDINEDFGTTLGVSVSEGGPTTWSEDITVDLTENQQVQENSDYVQDITINQLSFEITNYVGAENGKLTNVSINVLEMSIPVGDIDLKSADDNNTVFSVGTTEQLNLIAAHLKSEQMITATLTGTINTTPVSFNVKTNINATITIDVI